MRGICLKVVAVVALALVVSEARAADPCAPAQASGYGNPLASLIGQFAQQQRAQACVSERRAQWAEYNARQKAAQDKAAADAAQQKQVADAKDTAARAAAEAQHARAAHDTVVAEAHARHRREQSRADAQKEQLAAEARRRDDYVRLVRDENASDNVCHDAKMARVVMEGWNGLDTMKEASLRVIDIEHMTTVSAHASDQSVSCHGVFVTSRGGRVVGTATVRRNIAGDAMFVWERDANQDVSRYAAPSGVEVKVIKAMSVSGGGAPPI